MPGRPHASDWGCSPQPPPSGRAREGPSGPPGAPPRLAHRPMAHVPPSQARPVAHLAVPISRALDLPMRRQGNATEDQPPAEPGLTARMLQNETAPRLAQRPLAHAPPSQARPVACLAVPAARASPFGHPGAATHLQQHRSPHPESEHHPHDHAVNTRQLRSASHNQHQAKDQDPNRSMRDGHDARQAKHHLSSASRSANTSPGSSGRHRTAVPPYRQHRLWRR